MARTKKDGTPRRNSVEMALRNLRRVINKMLCRMKSYREMKPDMPVAEVEWSVVMEMERALKKMDLEWRRRRIWEAY